MLRGLENLASLDPGQTDSVVMAKVCKDTILMRRYFRRVCCWLGLKERKRERSGLRRRERGCSLFNGARGFIMCLSAGHGLDNEDLTI